MNAYAYDKEGYLIGKVKMQMDPMESKNKGKPVFLLPASATETAPPEVKEDSKIQKWDGRKWAIVDKPKKEETEIPEDSPEEKAKEKEVRQAMGRLKKVDLSGVKKLDDLMPILEDIIKIVSRN